MDTHNGFLHVVRVGLEPLWPQLWESKWSEVSGIFYPHRKVMFDSSSCIPFDFECFSSKVAFITTQKDADVGHFHFDVVMMSTSRQNCVTSYTTNQCKPNSSEKFSNLVEIRIYPKRKPLISLSGRQEILFLTYCLCHEQLFRWCL